MFVCLFVCHEKWAPCKTPKIITSSRGSVGTPHQTPNPSWDHTVTEQKLSISQKMTIWKLGLFLLKTTLTFCQVIILLCTMSQPHKVVHASLNLISGQHLASFHNVIENVTDIFFPKWAPLEQCETRGAKRNIENTPKCIHLNCILAQWSRPPGLASLRPVLTVLT